MGGAERDEGPSQWSDLPLELIALISEKVTDISDHIALALRSISAAWRSAAARPPQLPLLMLPYDPHDSARSFLSLATKRVCTLDLPEARGKLICASSHGWLVMLDAVAQSLSLLNPFTGSHIRLPPTAVWAAEIFETRVEAMDLNRWIMSAFLSSGPNSPDGCIVMVSFRHRKFAFCRPGSDAWTILDPAPLPSSVAGIAYHEGAFYVMDYKLNTAICDAGPPFNSTLIPSMEVPFKFNGFQMVKSSGGELLLVLHCKSRDCHNLFRILKLGQESERLSWSDAASEFDDDVLYSGDHCSCIPIPASGIAGRTFHIYFITLSYRNSPYSLFGDPTSQIAPLWPFGFHRSIMRYGAPGITGYEVFRSEGHHARHFEKEVSIELISRHLKNPYRILEAPHWITPAFD